MIEIKRINGSTGVKIEMHNANLLLVRGERGFIMCGYLDMEVAEKLGDAACIVTGVSSFDDVLKAKVKRVSSEARKLGIKEGMSGEEALRLLS